MNKEHYKKLERMYLGANVNTMLFDTTTVSIGEGKATIGLEVTEKYHHALGAMHGTTYFKLLDDAAFFAVSSLVLDKFVLTTNFNINIVRPVVSGAIKAVGEVRFQSANLFVGAASLLDANGREVAFGTGNFAKSKVALDPAIGYR